MNTYPMSWEEAVRWYKEQPNNEKNIYDNYFDDDVLIAAERYSDSLEFLEILKYFKNTETILDIAAGRGIASYGFAKAGKHVYALEPDQSSLVGHGAIQQLLDTSDVQFEIHKYYSEALPFEDKFFDGVFVRQGVHHFYDLEKSLQEIYRVLKPGGIFMAVREHVIFEEGDLEIFLNNHPLHKWYGGENAYFLKRYLDAFQKAGFKSIDVLSPFSSEINLYPSSKEAIRHNIEKTKGTLSDQQFKEELSQMDKRVKYPGIMYSFVTRKV